MEPMSDHNDGRALRETILIAFYQPTRFNFPDAMLRFRLIKGVESISTVEYCLVCVQHLCRLTPYTLAYTHDSPDKSTRWRRVSGPK